MSRRKDTSDDAGDLTGFDDPFDGPFDVRFDDSLPGRAGPVDRTTDSDDEDDVHNEDDDDARPRWDADDERRQKDCFAPPKEPCECYCLHCRRTFMSDGIWFQKIIGDPMGLDGFWMCPTPNCDGAGFTFDIFPTDPTHPANEGWGCDDGDEDEDDHDEAWTELDDDDPDASWDPGESKYKALDDVFGDGDDYDTEGEEWKYGLAPGEVAAGPDWSEQARIEQEEEERRYDGPDERPRVLDWSNREDRKPVDPGMPESDDDIPF